MTTTLIDTLTRPVESPLAGRGPADCKHLVFDPDRERDDVGAYLTEARVEGFAVEALCGYIFVPQRDPKPLPPCEPCKDIFAGLGFGDTEGIKHG